MRRVGVELEFAGLEVEEAARIVAEHSGGALNRVSDYEYTIEGAGTGAWGVEIDQARLKRMGRKRQKGEDVPVVEEIAEELLRLGSELVVPVEVVSPPLALDRLAGLDKLVDRLQDAGARGTGASPAYAFGLQFNPELSALDADTIREHLQAFLCLADWLKARVDVDATRALTGFARPFPSGYVRTVIERDYRPGLDGLIDDYVEENPTRNRALDLLPLFAHLDEPRVRAAVDDDRIKARPTFHYRLPNSELGREGWGIHQAWNDWVQVERLAADRTRLRRVCDAYRDWLDQPLERLVGNWANESEQWLNDTGGH